MTMIQEGLASNKVLETMDIDHVGWLGFHITRAATNAAADTTITGENLGQTSSTSNRHHLTLQLHNNHPILDQGCRWDLLRAPRLFHLKTLYLHNKHLAPEPRDAEQCTASIVAILQEAKNLQKLTLFRYRLLWLPVLEVLKMNALLLHFNAFLSSVDDSDKAKTICLGMLQKHNVTLQECAPLNNCPKIDYVLHLNRLGRASARYAEGSQLINLLVAASKDDYLASNCARFGSAPRATVSILYGILRESPGFWCHCGHTPITTTPTRTNANHARTFRLKRKREDCFFDRLVEFSFPEGTLSPPALKRKT